MMDLSLPALAADGERFSLADVLAWAVLGGAMAAPKARVELRLALGALAEAEGRSPPPDAVARDVRLWRRNRRLSSADETRAWLARHRLSLEDLTRFVTRRRATDEAPVDARPRARPPSADEVVRVLPDELCFEGDLPSLVEAFALRVVASGAGRKDLGEAPTRRAELFAWGLSAERIARLAEIEAAHREEEARLVESGAVERELERARAALGEVTVSSVHLERESVARELLAQLREHAASGTPPSLELEARGHGFAVERTTLLLGEVTPRVRRAKLSAARPGELLGPEVVEHGFRIEQLLERRPPEPSNPRVLARAVEAALARARSRARDERVELFYR